LALEMRKLKEDHIMKIVDLMPQNIDELKVILSHADIPFKDEEMQPILDVLKQKK
jgi:DNA-directed RNA polymerase subunit F